MAQLYLQTINICIIYVIYMHDVVRILQGVFFRITAILEIGAKACYLAQCSGRWIDKLMRVSN